MQAVLLETIGGDITPMLSEIVRPELWPGCVRVAVHASSINRADLLVRAGVHTPAGSADAPSVAGLDACGEVVEVAPDVSGINIGDRVMAMVLGGLAEEVVVPAAAVVPAPSVWSFAEGAAAITALMTEHNALVTAARLQPGETVLVHAAASGVATQAIALAKVLGAGRVFGTTRSHSDSPILRGLGLDELIDVSHTNFADRVLELTNGLGVDVIIDHVGGPYLEDNLRSAAIKARIIGVGRLGGAIGTLDMEELARKRVELIGVTFRTRSDEEKFAIAQALRQVDLEAHAEALRPLIHRTYPWGKVLEAQEELAANTHVGKIVLEIR
ncbi:zinc-binding dehydrogenase [Rhodococcus erythropolis]|uniref:zinc-binding dehydrogenase n=1 Tax=Rhodococcus erythropolis TaxID=1833 RepID=UPI00294A82B9|nr:zinc-binding dehydrogenase [Rhodococcus erythropolis]MDV6212740.1 zinc-binding dehydrogenase [Rhodococcus erythropolis]